MTARTPTTQPTATGWAVVTGTSSGLGREFALALSERGYPVLVTELRSRYESEPSAMNDLERIDTLAAAR